MNAITSTQPRSQSRHTAATASSPTSVTVINRAMIKRAVNQIHDPNTDRAGSDSNVTVTSVTMPTNSNPDPADLCLQIRKGLWKLYDLDDRDDWQTDLVAYLLQQDNHDEDYDHWVIAGLKASSKVLIYFSGFLKFAPILSSVIPGNVLIHLAFCVFPGNRGITPMSGGIRFRIRTSAWPKIFWSRLGCWNSDKLIRKTPTLIFVSSPSCVCAPIALLRLWSVMTRINIHF